jgi:hypothetical protein
VELGAPLRAEVAEHVGVPVRLLQQLDLPPNQAKALPEEALHSHCPPLKLSPGKGQRWRVQREQIKEGMGNSEGSTCPHLGESERMAFQGEVAKGLQGPCLQPALTGKRRSHLHLDPAHPDG